MERNNNYASRRKYQGEYKRGQRGIRRGVSRGGRSQRGMQGRFQRGRRPKRGAPGRINNYLEQNNNTIIISKEMIKDLINKDSNEIIQILEEYRDTPDFLGNSITIDSIDLITELFQKISRINSSITSQILFQTLKNTIFNDVIKKRLSQEDYTNENYLKFLLNLILLYDKLIDLFTDNSIRIKNGEISEHVNFIEKLMKEKKYTENIQLIENIVENMKKLIEKENHIKLIELSKKEKEKEIKEMINTNKKINLEDIKIDYQNRDIYLTSKDFKENNDIIIAPHIKSGSYMSYERYINTMFYLEYQDCYKNLKETIDYLKGYKSINRMSNKELYQLSKEFSNIYFYLEGEITNLDIDREGAIITIEFRTHSRNKIKFTKRMITGSLVILTDNTFENFLLGTVFYNPYVDKKLNNSSKYNIRLPKFPYYKVKLSLININQESFLFLNKNRQHLQIFESKAYFESYVHVMRRLKELNIPYLPFKEELIDGDFREIRNQNKNLYFYYNNMILYPQKEYYPKEFVKLFDQSQFMAIKESLVNRIALIQGPPGTGKTFVGTILTNILLQNMSKDSQILVVCFTNHALDSFIEDILNYTNSVVRIGGRCQNEKVEKYILDNKNKYSNKNYRYTIKKLDSIGENMGGITSLIDSRKRVSVGLVKKHFKPLFDKVTDDFFKIVKEGIINCKNVDKNNYKYKFLVNEEIFREIYIFWNLIDSHGKNNVPDEIIKKLLKNMKGDELNNLNSLYNRILDNFVGYELDNLELLKKLNNSDNIEEEKEQENDEKIEINNPNKQNEEEEEEEEDDEEELAENLERIAYLANDAGEEKEEQKTNEINLDALYDEKFDDLKRLKPLDDQKFNALVNSEINFFKIGPKIIKLIINYMKNKILLSNLNDYNEELEEFNVLLNEKKEILTMSDAEAIRNYKIVAMTTTGCAKYSAILEQNNFEVIIIEEAAEVLESHIIPLLTPKTKKLILIGDHKQLKPKPYNYDLETKYNFNVSMFERLINNKIPFSSLKYQRRMKPKFADFVRIIYGDTQYQDYDDLEKRPQVLGIESDMFFITHNKLEGENSGLKSKYNDYEAKYLVKLCIYLIQQGYKTNQITILTFYLGQVLRIKKFLKENLPEENYKEIRVSSVDNYQGEECDIILLSLVRSNRDFKIGFLKTFNRVCVAFSRAKIGFYIIGNINCIIKGEKIFRDKNKNNKNVDTKMLYVWQRIEEKAKKINIIGDNLTLICQNHKNKTIIQDIKDFAKCPDGGCNQKCRKRMKCGHVCEQYCHNYDCEKIKCEKPCPRINKNCQYKEHLCTKKCWEDCGKCEVLVNKKLRCGHIQKNIKCCDKTKICEELVDKRLPCGHVQKVKCCKRPKVCEVLVDKRLPCGHVQNVKCCEETKKCRILVNKLLSCGHTQLVKCYKDPELCEELVDKKLRCGHIQKNVKCCERPKPCKELVDKKLPCGHIQKNVICCEKPKECLEFVDKLLPCGHTNNNYCYLDPKNITCPEKCTRKLSCGHICQLKCYENCKNCICNEKIRYNVLLCNHINMIECYLKSEPTKIVCQEPCLEKLPCGHICAGKCGLCLQGTLHIPCKKKCSKRLICSHICSKNCSEECICEEKCEKFCEHKHCSKNCYDTCENCLEKCSNECKHRKCMEKCGELCDVKPCNKRCEKILECKHQCFGLCGERCPDICGICDSNALNKKNNKENELLYKTYCGHIVLVKEIESIFAKKNIDIYKCPKCEKPLLFEKRYQNKIKTYFKNIRKIKREIYDKNVGIENSFFLFETKSFIEKNILSQGYFKLFDILTKGKINTVRKSLKTLIPISHNFIENAYQRKIKYNASFYYLITLVEKFIVIEYFFYLIKNQKMYKLIEFEFIKNFNVVKNYFETFEIQFNQHFFNDLKRKIDNMLHYSIIVLTKEKEEKNPLFSFFRTKKITSKDIINSYFSLDLNLKVLYPKTPLESEKKIIFKSLSSKWFVCQNDHFYVAEEVEENDKQYSCPHCTVLEKAYGWMKAKFS